ncbi:MAG TPA: tRNA 2-selenouridine(34) synthase MnmH [Chitinophagaceae bacterium]
MGVEKINIERFLELAEKFPVLDVRSPGEFLHAHIPGAFSLPLFTDEERKIVGTAYKQQSRFAAIKDGLDFFGPKMRRMVEEVEMIAANWKPAAAVAKINSNSGGMNNGDIKPEFAPNKISGENRPCKTVLVHCWRGGMRSGAVSWLLDLYGFKVYTLTGGYKSFRNWVIKQFGLSYRFNILGGYTGSGKTEVLKELESRNQLVIDLELLAGHKGSAFGNIGLPPQPTQEMFENLLGIKLNIALRKSLNAQQQPIWLEDESQRIGSVNIPQPLWLSMRNSSIYFLDIPFEERLQHIVAEYGSLDRERIKDAITRLQKRLGGLETKTALASLEEDNILECFHILLKYYDKYYQKGLNNRSNLEGLLTNVRCTTIDAGTNAVEVLKHIQTATVS